MTEKLNLDALHPHRIVFTFLAVTGGDGEFLVLRLSGFPQQPKGMGSFDTKEEARALARKLAEDCAQTITGRVVVADVPMKHQKQFQSIAKRYTPVARPLVVLSGV
jgi:hypothetical protein